ncbi:MAG: AAA family ATPase [Rhodobacteraceae bacterium]|nr:AAA family ATPase [Paracoccaceae bacterium]
MRTTNIAFQVAHSTQRGTDEGREPGGLDPSDLIILAGRPSMGKTALATNIAFQVAHRYQRNPDDSPSEGTGGSTQAGGVVGFFSLEMSAEQLASRILAEQAGVSAHQLRQGNLTEDEFHRFTEAARDLEFAPLFIDDTPALSISQLAARARRLKRRALGLDLVVVDYLQLCRGTRPTSLAQQRVHEITEISMGLKAMAKELNVPVLALSQLSRQVESREDKRPQLSDLRESGSIEQDADVVMFLFREEYYTYREQPSDSADVGKHEQWQAAMNAVHGRAEVIIGKQRHGPIGSVALSFEAHLTRFANAVQDSQQDAQW